jgi:XRE family transcriptional regulator, regulator of sulfur utilization
VAYESLCCHYSRMYDDEIYNIHKLIALRLKTQRNYAGFSQELLADMARIDRTYVSKIERGITNPSIDTLEKIATALGTPLSEVVDGPHPNPDKHACFRLTQIQLGFRIKSLRKLARLSKATLASKIGVDPIYIYQCEQSVTNPSLLLLSKIANALNTTVSELTN